MVPVYTPLMMSSIVPAAQPGMSVEDVLVICIQLSQQKYQLDNIEALLRHLVSDSMLVSSTPTTMGALLIVYL